MERRIKNNVWEMAKLLCYQHVRFCGVVMVARLGQVSRWELGSSQPNWEQINKYSDKQIFKFSAFDYNGYFQILLSKLSDKFENFVQKWICLLCAVRAASVSFWKQLRTAPRWEHDWSPTHARHTSIFSL
jgi:hypothetical protein